MKSRPERRFLSSNRPDDGGFEDDAPGMTTYHSRSADADIKPLSLRCGRPEALFANVVRAATRRVNLSWISAVLPGMESPR